MKIRWTRILFLAIICMGLFHIAWPGHARAANIRVLVNGSELTMDVPPRMENNRTLVPLRACAEALEAQVDYDAATNQVTIKQDEMRLTLTLNSANADLNGVPLLLDVPAKTVNGRTLVPLRFVGEAFQAQVDWISALNLVKITMTSETDLGTITGNREEENKLLELCNEARTADGLDPLIWVEELSQMGRSHCKDMGVNSFFSHQSPSFGDTAQRASLAGLPPVAENLAFGYETAQEIFDAWMASPDHKANIMNPLCHYMGAGIWQEADGTIYGAAEFINTCSFMVQTRPVVTGADIITVRGYSIQSQADLCLYYLVSNDTRRYSARRSLSASTNENTFTAVVELDQQGSYALETGEDIVLIVKQ